MLRIMHRDAPRKMPRDALGMRARCAGTRYNISFSGFGGSRRIFLLLFHQYLDIKQLFPIGFGSLFSGDVPKVFPNFVVEGIDFGGFSIGDGAIGGIVHYFLLSAYMLFQTQMFYQRLFKTILLCSICQGVRLCFLKLLKSGRFFVECRFIDTVKTYILVW